MLAQRFHERHIYTTDIPGAKYEAAGHENRGFKN